METKTNLNLGLRCFGCGALIQNTNPNLTGFLPKTINTDGAILCQRCFRLQHYGEDVPNPNFSSEYQKVMSGALKNKCLIIYVVDLFAFESSLVLSIFDYLKACPLLVVANKRDVLPKSVDDNKLISFVKTKLEEYDLKPEKIIISSAYKNTNIDEIIKTANSLRKNKDIYVVGAASVGKSSLINSFLKVYKNETKTLISTSPYPGTTLDVIRVPLDDKTFFYDTPGIMVEEAIFSHVDRNAMKYIFPRREINPRTFQMNSQQSILVGGIARFDFIKGPKSGFTFYVSNECDLTRTKLEKADQTFESLISSRSTKPITQAIKNINDLEVHEFVLPSSSVDIMISGLLWIKCECKDAIIKVHAPKGVSVLIRSCKI